MKDRYKIRCAVFLILTKRENDREYVLLQRRFNTGLLDGQYNVSASGHLEQNESLKDAMIREAKEEIGIDIKKEDLNYVSNMHAKFKDNDYLFTTFSASKYQGFPNIMEKDKCDQLQWYEIDNLPTNIIETRKIMIDNYLTNNQYCEYGFDK